MADVTTAVGAVNKNLTTMGLTTSVKEYSFTVTSGGIKQRKVTIYCDAPWKVSDASAGVYLDVPESPCGYEVQINAPSTSVFAKVGTGTATITPTVTE